MTKKKTRKPAKAKKLTRSRQPTKAKKPTHRKPAKAKKPTRRKPTKAKKPVRRSRKPKKKSSRKRSSSFKTGAKYKKIDTRAGESFRIYTKYKRLPRSQPLNLENFGRYFEGNIVPEFHSFWLRQRKIGRIQFIFRVKTQLFIFKKKIKEFFSSFRNDIISEDEFDDQMQRLQAEFQKFLQHYISKGVLNQLTISGVSMEVSIPNKPESKKRARVASKAKGKKKVAKKVGGSRHRKR